MYNNRCSFCGAYLDPGEQCDCMNDIRRDTQRKDKPEPKDKKQSSDMKRAQDDCDEVMRHAISA
jgi:hypothetical protein